MGLTKFKERRVSDRRQLTGLLPGRLVLAATLADVACRPVDVSVNGLGIIAADQKRRLQPGVELLLLLKDRHIPLVVSWGQGDFGKQDLFRFGLVTVDTECDLEALFLRTGCLK